MELVQLNSIVVNIPVNSRFYMAIPYLGSFIFLYKANIINTQPGAPELSV